MNWDWGNFALATAALTGIAAWIFQFCCIAQSETNVPDKKGISLTGLPENDDMDADLEEIEKRLAVIRGSAQMLLEDQETDEVRSLMCQFIIEEADRLTCQLKGS
jgi:hypothetical protein